MNQAYCMDCMEALKQMPDKCFDLAVVDPPYGDACEISRGGGTGSASERRLVHYIALTAEQEWTRR